MMTIILTLFFLFSSVLSGFYEDVDIINTDLDQNTFVEKVLRSPGVWVIEFYAPWCPHCRNFQSEFKLAAENLEGLVNFAAIDCDVEGNKPLCGHFKIESLPTVLAFKAFLEPIEVQGEKGLTKPHVKYQGPLKPAALAKWAVNFLSDPVDPVLDISSKNINVFLEEQRAKYKGLLFSDKEKKSNLLRAVAHNFKIDYLTTHWLPIGQVPHTEKEIVDRYGITTYPTLIIVDEKGEQKDVYSGQFSNSELSSFLKTHAHVVTPEDLQPKEPPKQKPKTPPPPPKPKEIKLHHVTDQQDFDSVCFQLGLCFITFLDPQYDEHQSYIDTLNQIVKLYPSVQVMWLDGTKHTSFKDAFGLAESYPQAVAYQRKAKRYRIFMGGFDVSLLSEFIDLVQAGTSKKGRIAILDVEPAVGDEDKDEL